MVLGAVAAYATAPLAMTGWGAVFFVSALDNATAGLETLLTGKYQQTATASFISGRFQSLGYDKESSDLAGEIGDMAVGIISGSAVARLANENPLVLWNRVTGR